MSYIKYCRICCSKLISVLDLGTQPLANDYHDNTYPLKEYPLHLVWCPNCTHLQLNYVIDKNILYKNYPYVSGTSYTLDNYFNWLANKITDETDNISFPKSILELACNDASQLAHFKKLGWDTFGVDPATNIVSKIKENEHIIYNEFFTFDFAKKLDIKFNVILAQNVVAHVDQVIDFIKGCEYLLADDGILYIQTSQCNMIQNNEFDTIYHEHHSFFNIKSMTMLVELCGLVLKRVIKTSIHGISFLFTITRTSRTSLEDMILQEQLVDESYLYNPETYIQYAKNVDYTCTNLIHVINDFRKIGYKIVGYGAAAKGNTVLNHCKIQLDYIVDDSDVKWNLYTPGMNIPIFSPDRLSTETDKIIIIPLAWNFFDEIVTKIKQKGVKAYLIKYFPYIQILDSEL